MNSEKKVKTSALLGSPCGRQGRKKTFHTVSTIEIVRTAEKGEIISVSPKARKIRRQEEKVK